MAVEVPHGAMLGGAHEFTMPLQQNVSIASFVREECYEFFQVCVANPSADRVHSIFFEVISHDGDADLYISTEYDHPDKIHATWISADVGTDRITLRTDMDDFVAAREKLHAGRGLTLFLGVYGRTASHFSVHVEIAPYETLPPRGLLRGKYKHRFKKKRPFVRPELPKHIKHKH
jgi:hypothetical protein